jgi:hypothetical protein
MRLVIGVLCLLATAAPAMACNSEMLTVVGWQAIKDEGNPVLPYSLSAEVKYEGHRAYRMIHAGVMFSDVLGEALGQVNLAKDQNVSPGDSITADGLVDVDKRIGTISRDDIAFRTCVWSIVYDDGTVEEFN